MRLTYNTVADTTKCRTCLALDKKHRRYAKTKSDLDRWSADPERKASAAKAAEECQQISDEIETLNAERASRYTKLGSNHRAAVGSGRTRCDWQHGNNGTSDETDTAMVSRFDRSVHRLAQVASFLNNEQG